MVWVVQSLSAISQIRKTTNQSTGFPCHDGCEFMDTFNQVRHETVFQPGYILQIPGYSTSTLCSP